MDDGFNTTASQWLLPTMAQSTCELYHHERDGNGVSGAINNRVRQCRSAQQLDERKGANNLINQAGAINAWCGSSQHDSQNRDNKEPQDNQHIIEFDIASIESKCSIENVFNTEITPNNREDNTKV